MEYVIGSPDSEGFVVIIRKWINEYDANSLFNYYKDNTYFIQTKGKIFGKEYASPRLMQFVGDNHVNTHTYSGQSFIVKDWDPVSENLRNIIVKETVMYYDSALINYYRNGNDYIAYHSDKEALGQGNSVVGLSLGASRRFYFKNIENPSNVVKLVINTGDIMMMYGNINSKWKHTVPKQKGVGERISLTFRNMTNVNIPYTGHLEKL